MYPVWMMLRAEQEERREERGEGSEDHHLYS
jgi:hypothetical protein